MRSPGKTTVAPDVLLSIARLTALKVAGVHGMGGAPLWGRAGKTEEGVTIQVEGERVDLDIYLVLKNDVNVRQVSREVQDLVSRAISEMIGMEAGRVNIHIEDIHFPEALSAA